VTLGLYRNCSAEMVCLGVFELITQNGAVSGADTEPSVLPPPAGWPTKEMVCLGVFELITQNGAVSGADTEPSVLPPPAGWPTKMANEALSMAPPVKSYV
jgi:hypothetical protein